MVPSMPCNQLHGIRDTHQNTCSAPRSAHGSCGNGGGSPPPSHTHASPPDSSAGWCPTGTRAANCSARTVWVGHSTTRPDT